MASPVAAANDLRASNLLLAYGMASGAQTVLDLDELTVAPGSAVGITGPSGSGKTSLLYVLAGLERLQQGTVRWGEAEISRLPEADRDRWRRTHVGMVFQDFHLLPGMTALQNILVASTFDRLAVPASLLDRARSLLTRVGLSGGLQRIETFSRGEMQRVAVARALLFAPPIVLADEPTASLDRASGERVTALLLDLCRETRATLLIVSHDATLLRRLETVHTLVAGRLAAGPQSGLQPC
jgi:putative ABC transport system ATP-binding protein